MVQQVNHFFPLRFSTNLADVAAPFPKYIENIFNTLHPSRSTHLETTQPLLWSLHYVRPASGPSFWGVYPAVCFRWPMKRCIRMMASFFDKCFVILSDVTHGLNVSSASCASYSFPRMIAHSVFFCSPRKSWNGSLLKDDSLYVSLRREREKGWQKKIANRQRKLHWNWQMALLFETVLHICISIRRAQLK